LGHIYPDGAPAQSPLCRVGAFTTVNLNWRYSLSKQWSVRAAVTNLLNTRPPIDAFASSSPGGGVAAGGAHYNPSLHQDGAVGRSFMLGASYSF
jgi:iron complex outermembrane receptor protein